MGAAGSRTAAVNGGSGLSGLGMGEAGVGTEAVERGGARRTRERWAEESGLPVIGPPKRVILLPEVHPR